MRTYKVTQVPHYDYQGLRSDAKATVVASEPC